MKNKVLVISIFLNFATLVFAIIYIDYKGGLCWIESKLLFVEQRVREMPKFPLPSVDQRILLIGDSHLAIHPWAEYSSLPFSNRAVSGSRINDINIESIEGYPALVVISAGTNDIQTRKDMSTEEIKKSLISIFSKIKKKWPESLVVYVLEPYPDIKLYEKCIRPKFPNINRPDPEQIDSIGSFVSSLGILTIQANSANIDGLHMDPESAISIVGNIEEIIANQKGSFQKKLNSSK